VILHPGILALIGGSSLVLAMTLYAAALGLRVLARWDYDSHAEGQLALERRTYLISTIVNYALGFQILSSLLFIFTLDDIHGLFTGAMCATGSLNANPIGWSALLASLVTLLACGIWVVLNQIDQGSEDYPLVRLKYGALLLVAPLLGLTLGLQIAYFRGLRPEIIRALSRIADTAPQLVAPFLDDIKQRVDRLDATEVALAAELSEKVET